MGAGKPHVQPNKGTVPCQGKGIMVQTFAMLKVHWQYKPHRDGSKALRKGEQRETYKVRERERERQKDIYIDNKQGFW